MNPIVWEKTYKDKKYVKSIVIEGTRGLTPKHCLDLGCGIFKEAEYLVERGWTVLAVDQNEEVRKYHRDNAMHHIIFIKSLLEEFECQIGFELILALNVLPFCDKNKFMDVMNKIKKLLLPGGRLIINFFGLDDEYNEEGKPFIFLNKEEVLSMFECGYKLIHFAEIYKTGERFQHIIELIVDKE